jgi:DNA-binding beta-propeller fold protein YncE
MSKESIITSTNSCTPIKTCQIYVANRKCDLVNVNELYDNLIVKNYYTNHGNLNHLEITTPNNMKFDKYGNLYVVNQKPAQLIKIDYETKKLSILGQFPCHSLLKSLIIDDSCGNIYVTDCLNKAIYKISNITEKFNTTDICTPYDLVYDNVSKSLFVTNTSNIIYKISCKGEVTCYCLDKCSKCSRFTGIVLTKSRKLFIADRTNNKIIIIDNIDDKILLTRDFTSDSYLDRPGFMTLDQYNNIYVVNNSKEDCDKENKEEKHKHKPNIKVVKVDHLGFQKIYNTTIENATGIASLN